MEVFFLIFFLVVVIGYFLYRVFKNKITDLSPVLIPKEWKNILIEKVHFYNGLDADGQHQFEQDCYRFLQDVKVGGYKGAVVTLSDRLLVASSAVMPLFAFPE